MTRDDDKPPLVVEMPGPITHRLDITALLCPMTFVHTKLLLEKMSAGAIAEVRLKGTEPLHNVPRSVRQSGHEILGMRDDAEDADAKYLYIRKNG